MQSVSENENVKLHASKIRTESEDRIKTAYLKNGETTIYRKVSVCGQTIMLGIEI